MRLELALTRAAAIDHVGEGVRINCIAPGTVDTPWIERITGGYDDPAQARRDMESRQPHGRFVTPEEIAAMAVYLDRRGKPFAWQIPFPLDAWDRVTALVNAE